MNIEFYFLRKINSFDYFHVALLLKVPQMWNPIYT